IERISQKAEKAGIGQDADFVYARLAAEKMIKDAPDCDKISPETTAIVKLRDMTKKLIDEKDLRSIDILKLTARHILETYVQAREDDVIKRGYNKVEREMAKKRPKVKDLADAIKSFTTKLSDFRNSNRAFIKESIDSFYSLAQTYKVDGDPDVVKLFRNIYLSLYTAYSPDDFRDVFIQIQHCEKTISDAILTTQEVNVINDYAHHVVAQAKILVDDQDVDLCANADHVLQKAQEILAGEPSKQKCSLALDEVRNITMAENPATA
ncbi:MAG: hypothetical protein LBM27_04460, partial [Lactobacillaceae bacterium]|nr:hypothetical protein [Lactobacillaceae bacterium]